jgi:O-methyltransferase involved in polyketide biosynthesis
MGKWNEASEKTGRSVMKQMLSKEISGNPSFIIMEGLTYYLKPEILTELLEIFSGLQTRDSLIAFDYWKPDAMTYPVMIKLKEYLQIKFGFEQNYNLFDENYIKSVKGHEEIESKDIAVLELEYSETRIFQGRDNKIPVYFSVLKRI